MRRILPTVMIICTVLLSTIATAKSYQQEAILPIPLETNPSKSARLGEELFAHKAISKGHLTSCKNCHEPKKAYYQIISGNLQTLSLLNARYNNRFFWDGRALTLKEAIKASLYDSTMMGNDPNTLITRLNTDKKMVKAFNHFYKDGLTEDSLVDALEQYIKTLTTPNAPFDRYLKGDQQAISAEAVKGYELFKSYGCINCHQGINVGGNLMQKYGIYKNPIDSPKIYDRGQYNQTLEEEDKFVFRVPSLRTALLTQPYMHNGSQKTLKEAIKHMGTYQLNQEIEDNEATLIEAFLRSLTTLDDQS